LIKEYGVDVPMTITGNYRLGDIRHNFADLTKITSKLGFLPEVTFESGIKKFADWVNKQAVNQDKYQESIDEMRKKGLYK
jgi:dTDP-L-rhamnose 4-epimerase